MFQTLGARGRPQLTAWAPARRLLSWLASLALAGALAACTPARQPVPLSSPDERHSAPVRPPQPDVPEPPAPEKSTLTEEELPAEIAQPPSPTGDPAVIASGSSTAGTGNAPAGTGNASAGVDLAMAPPSLIDTITPRTPPNVAAATRITDGARTRMAAGDYAAALEQLERAIAIDPSNTYAYYFLAELHLHHQTYDQAIAFADRAAALSRSAAPNWSSRAYTLQGNAFEAAGRFADARKAYERALAVAPQNLPARVGLARVGGPAAAP